jgi:hypothetical protein
MLIRRHSGDHEVPEVSKHTVGNALVVHHGEQMTKNAHELALAVAEDPEHDLVIVDLPIGLPIAVWQSVASVLPRRRRALRLVIGGRSRETSAMAGQWLSERLGRVVVAPDGTVTLGAGGSLFVHSGRGSGWVRFEPGHAPHWLAKRFPQPVWDSPLIAEVSQTSALGVVEPLPGGLWIRPTGFSKEQRPHRAQLIRTMPLQKDILTVVLGAPESPPLTLDDAARVWVQLPEQLRRSTRFVHYGPMAVPGGAPLGQALADLLGSEVAVYTGLPTGSPRALSIQTVRSGGTPGWAVFAGELGYRPRLSGPRAPLPTLLSHRVPVVGLQEVAPAVYWYAPDAVVEVIQSGLLVRGPSGGVNTPAVRSVTLDPGTNNVTFDAADDATAPRMRYLAEDLLGRLDQATRRVSRLLPASALVAEPSRVQVSGPALARIEADASAPAPAASPPGQNPPAEPSVGAVAGRHPRQGGYQSEGPAPAFAEPVDLPVQRGQAAPPSAGDPTGPPPALEQPTERVPAGPPAPIAPSPLAQEHSGPRGALPLAPEGFRLESAGVPTVDVTGPPGPPAPPGDDRAPLPDLAPDPEPGRSADFPAAGVLAAGAPDVPGAPAGYAPGRDAALQPAPRPEAAAVLPPHGLEEEREWFRRDLAGEYGTMSNAVARVLAEHPGFQGELSRNSAEVLTDAVAVRLYLSPRGELIDQALRTAAPGAHVPIARCVVAGLSRLPSHRGPSMFTVSPTPEQWTLYRDHSVLTEWGFLNAFAGPYANLDGDTEVLVWSISGRRTRLLELDGDPVEDRVVFVPGTGFKILELSEPGESTRGLILLREIAVTEIDETGLVDPHRTALDDLALRSLRQELEKWTGSPPQRKIGRKAAARFGVLPGLV